MSEPDGGPGAGSHTTHLTEVDGVPVYYPSEPVPGPRLGALLFRVGRADEPPAMGGITHLVEHLALAPLAQQDYGHNGFVAGWRTVLHAVGTDDELVDFFGRVTASLRSLPLDRLAMERRILRQESTTHERGIVARLLWLRFGFAGHGLVFSDEAGLSWLGPGHIESWARDRFVRQNAVAWFSGPPPAGLRFDLGDGEPTPAVPLAPTAGLRFPAHLSWAASGASIGYLAERSAAAVVTINAAARKARDVLRFERGLVYDVHNDYEPLDGTVAHAYIGADAQPDDVATVRDVLLGVLESIARNGLTEEEIRREVRQYHDGLQVPQSMLGVLDAAATSHLLGRERESQAEITAEYDAITPEQTAAVTSSALETMLVGGPGDAPVGRSWFDYPTWSTGAVSGRTVRAPGWPIRNRTRKDRLTVGPDGVTWSDGDGGNLTVRYEDCVTYLHWEGDRRELRGRDGFTVRVAAESWADGAAIVRQIDAAVPPGVVACGEHGIGGMEDPK